MGVGAFQTAWVLGCWTVWMQVPSSRLPPQRAPGDGLARPPLQARGCKPRVRSPRHQEELNEVGVPWTTGVSREVPGPPLELHTGRPRACSRGGSLPQGDTAQGSPYQGTDAVGPGYQRARDVKSPQASSGKLTPCVPRGRVFASSAPGHLQAHCARVSHSASV